jgi:circadian clock protein KaiC
MPRLEMRAEGPSRRPLPKASTGIEGLDEITQGGLPRGRATLLCGGPGCGKTALAMEFIGRGALEMGEPGLYVSFEETAEDLAVNFADSGWNLPGLLKAGTVRLESVFVERRPAPEAGRYTLDGLLVRLDHWLAATDARRLVLDSADALFAGFSVSEDLRAEFTRIIRWARERELTVVVVAERGAGHLTRHEVEEYVSDCVLLLDHRVSEQLSQRRLRVIKYRGSGHGADEYPFLITGDGVSVMPVTSLGLDTVAPTDFVSSGVDGLDAMLAGEGFYRGSSVMVSGGAGTGKSTLGAAFAKRACVDGGTALLLTYEESSSQLVRNMRSVGLDLEPDLERGALRIEPARPNTFGLEHHLLRIKNDIEVHEPTVVVMDPVTAFAPIGDLLQVRSMMTRVLDYLKTKGTTVLMTSLNPAGSSSPAHGQVSSLVDAWIVLDYHRVNGRRHRVLHIEKARGLRHSEELAELVFSHDGPEVRPMGEEIGQRMLA